MKIDAWHKIQLAADPDYKQAVALVAAAQDSADLVIRLRVQSRLSQTQVAKLAGTTQAVISRLEAGLGNPTVELLTRVLNVLVLKNGDGSRHPAGRAARRPESRPVRRVRKRARQ